MGANEETLFSPPPLPTDLITSITAIRGGGGACRAFLALSLWRVGGGKGKTFNELNDSDESVRNTKGNVVEFGARRVISLNLEGQSCDFLLLRDLRRESPSYFPAKKGDGGKGETTIH